MSPARRLRRLVPTLTALVAFVAVPTLVVLISPGPNVVSAEVYSNEVGFIKVDTVDNGAVFASVPLTLLGDDPHYGLNNESGTALGQIGAMLAADLKGSTGLVTADKIMYFDSAAVPPRYRVAWLYDDGTTLAWLEGWNMSTLELEPGKGFWVLRSNSSDADTITFLGEVRTDESVAITLKPGYNMFSWPYPTTHDVQASTLGADGAYGSTGSATADRIGAYDAATGYSWHWLYDDGTTQAWLEGWNLSTLQFQAGKGYWYYRQAAQGEFVWNCARPY